MVGGVGDGVLLQCHAIECPALLTRPPPFRNSPVSNSLDVVDFFVALTKADQDTKLGFEHKEVVNSNTTSFRALKIED